MKIIDLISMRAEGKEMPKKIRIDHWCYKFEWIEHDENYYDKYNDIDLMSCLSMSQEELNYKVKIIEEDKKIEKLNIDFDEDDRCDGIYISKESFNYKNRLKINEIIDYLMEDNK